MENFIIHICVLINIVTEMISILMMLMLLQVLLSTLCLVASITADKSFPSDRELSHVVRVGRNGRQVIHRQPGARSGQGRKVVRKQRKGASRARQERQFVAPVPAPLTFNLPPPAPVAPAPAKTAE